MNFKLKAVDHLFTYLDARSGNLDIFYEDSYQSVINAIIEYIKMKKRKDVKIYRVGDYTETLQG